MRIEAETLDATADKEKSDRFHFDLCSFDLHFPCVVCIHREKPEDDVCTGCRYYFK